MISESKDSLEQRAIFTSMLLGLTLLWYVVLQYLKGLGCLPSEGLTPRQPVFLSFFS